MASKPAWYKTVKGLSFKGPIPLKRPPLCSICKDPRENVNSQTCGGVACLIKLSEDHVQKLQMSLDRGDIDYSTFRLYSDSITRATFTLGKVGGIKW
mgnify:FL=1